MPKQTVSSGTKWEALAGYSRAVRIGNTIYVSGTTASTPEGPVGSGDPAAQMRFIIDKIETALKQLGGSLNDVVRTRVFVSDIAHWEPVARVHGERFGAIKPANTLVEARLVAPELLVEMEAEAVIGAGGGAGDAL
jgi:enamine deaminase RidA (YjgF/YER057c/UK114 family)